MTRLSTFRQRVDGGQPKSTYRILTNEEIAERLICVKQSRGRSSLVLQSKHILYHLMLMLKHEFDYADFVFHPSKEKLTLKSPEQMGCKLTGVGRDTMREILNDVDEVMHDTGSMVSVKEKWGEQKRRGNFKRKKCKISRDKKTRDKVQKFIRDKRKKWERCCTRDVVTFLVDKGKLEVEKGGYQSATVTTWRYLKAKGFKFRKSKKCLANTAKLDEYLLIIKENRALPEHMRWREVYLDESYIHNHHNHWHLSLYDPTDELDDSTGPPNKGQRLCIVAAIQMKSLKKNVQNPHAGLVPGSDWYFQPKPTKDGKEHEGDYHKNFNQTNFLMWVQEKLLPNLHEPSIIILDNAKYHKCYDNDVAEYGKWNKAKCIAYLTKKACKTRAASAAIRKLSAKELKAKVREHIKANEKMMITKVCEEKGHKVVFTPPRYSDLQPIELVWANIKGNIGRDYAKGTTMKDIERRLQREFQKILDHGSMLVGDIIHSTNRKFYKFCRDAFGDDIPKEFRDRNHFMDLSDDSDDDAEDSDYFEG